MRVVLLTDSLGCPRDEVRVEDVWTEKILSDKSLKSFTFYTQCFYNLSTRKIDISYLKRLNPDIIVCQIGIVDACRRALTPIEQAVISKTPFFGSLIHKICSKYHFFASRIRNIHDANPEMFSKTIDDLAQVCNRLLVLVEIAPAGEFLRDKVFNVVNDIKLYNDIIYSKNNIFNIKVLKPYSHYGLSLYNEYIIKNDGHHINQKGNKLVFDAVKDCLLNLLI